IETYIDNCRAIKKFRDKNLPFKNYRILDMMAWKIDKYQDNGKNDSKVKDTNTDYLEDSSKYTFDIDVTYEDWKKLINQDDIFRDNDMDMIITMINAGGSCTGKELGIIYNKSHASFNSSVGGLGQRIKNNIDIEVSKRDNGTNRWWSVLFNGEYTNDNYFRWEVRPELEEAVRETYPEKFESSINYYWINANSDVWSYRDIEIGEEANYEYYNDNGNKRRLFNNFKNAKPGDRIFGYLTSPKKLIVALLEIKRNENEVLYFKKIKDIANGVSYDDIKEIEGLQNMEVMKNPNGSLFKVEQNEAAVLLKMIESRNKDIQPILKTYNKQKFLKDVFINEEEYDDLKSLVLRKKNIILQGPPGVGKTFAAKKLAFSIIGYKDESKVKSIQFHQSYSYEDFMMGYRPKEDKFSLEYGVFYNFCDKARKDKENKYFFIIDEINRGNLSKIFGELLMLLEKDKRDQEIHLAYGDEMFSVPENLYIIGTMNTADRSLAIIDYALRRRFSFFELEPAFGKECFKNFLNDLNMEEDLVNRIIGRVDNLNIQIEDSSNLGKGFKIGHSYFCDYDIDDENWYENVIKYEIKPLLEEYWFDDLEKAKEYVKILLGG
ncbi:MAG TPA: AAA family ATPase, partial [Candidatus Absconditabacterales bacterium]|nr:AAA family ATPase [Candidatus Absconditabacterales bacterium]